MIVIKRSANGIQHTVDGVLFEPEVKPFRKKVLTHAVQMKEAFSVETLEGTMRGNAFDWLMVGVEGEMYPCDNGIFETTYETVI